MACRRSGVRFPSFPLAPQPTGSDTYYSCAASGERPTHGLVHRDGVLPCKQNVRVRLPTCPLGRLVNYCCSTKGMKTCSGPCGRDLPEEDFHWRSKSKGLRISQCRLCTSDKSKSHYTKNKGMYLRKAKKWDVKNRTENIEKLVAYLKLHPCVDCGEEDPLVLTFDHVRGEKRDSISRMTQRNGCSWDTVLLEIAKCVVRCANCHMRRTALQFGWHKRSLLV